MLQLSILGLTLILQVTSSLPTPQTLRSRADPVSQLLLIAPTADTCDAAPFPAECTTASDAIEPIISSFAQCNITTAAEQAALLSWMAYESADFKYNQNHFPAPGNPGQGTRTMMMPNYVAEYAAFLPAVADEVQGKSSVEVLALVQPDQYSFGSAAWFYHEMCSESIKQGVQTGGQAGWEAFLTGCVGTNPSEGVGDTSRLAYWQRACQALAVLI